MTSRACNRCGAISPAGAVRCPRCGRPLSTLDRIRLQRSNQRRAYTWRIPSLCTAAEVQARFRASRTLYTLACMADGLGEQQGIRAVWFREPLGEPEAVLFVLCEPGAMPSPAEPFVQFGRRVAETLGWTFVAPEALRDVFMVGDEVWLLEWRMGDDHDRTASVSE